MNNGELFAALLDIVKDKGLSKDYLLETIRTALIHAYKKNYKSEENVDILFDEKTGQMRLITQKTVVEELNEDKVEAQSEILLDEAKKIKKDSNLGDILEIEFLPRDFGRIAAQTGKQIIMQKIREAEREQVLKELQIKANDIITAKVQRFEKADTMRDRDGKPIQTNKLKQNIILDIGKAEAVLPPKEQINGELYKPHDRLKVYVIDVRKAPRGPAVVVSRIHPELVKRLFEREVPEIEQGVVEIKSIAREAGLRTKMAVMSHSTDVDPVGSCVGNRGARVNAVVNELKGERIDIVNYYEDTEQYITSALSPAKVIKVLIDDMSKRREAVVIVEDGQLSLAIGKEGQNARLAAKLTGWKIDIKSDRQIEEAEGISIAEYIEGFASSHENTQALNNIALSKEDEEALFKVDEE